MTHSTSVRRCEICNARLAWDNADMLCSPCRKSRTSALGPPSVPPDFWESTAMQTALANWHMGRVVRAYRHHAWHGSRPLPQDVVAGWFGLTQTQVSRIESGSAMTDLDKLITWARTLKIPPQYLWFQLPDDRPASMSPSSSPDYASPDSTPLARREMIGQERLTTTDGGEDTRRKDFLVLAGTSLASMLAPPLIHGWREWPTVQVPELDDLLVAQLRAQTAGFRWLDRQHGSSEQLPSTARHAHNLANLWRLTDDRHGLRDQLGELAANACQLVGYQFFDQGRRAQAGDWHRSSAELAAHAGSQDFYVLAMREVAYLHARNGERGLALSILHQLHDLPLSAAARCHVEVGLAHAHASGGRPEGDRRDAALRALEQAEAFAAQTENEAPSPVHGVPNSAHVDLARAHVLAELGDPGVLPGLGAQEVHLPAVYQVARVRLASSFALTYAHMGEVDQATAYLATAVQRNRQLRSVETTTRILEARRILDPYRDTRAVRAADELLHDSGVRALNAGL